MNGPPFHLLHSREMALAGSAIRNACQARLIFHGCLFRFESRGIYPGVAPFVNSKPDPWLDLMMELLNNLG
jgi:hypothetical protein